MRKLFVTSLFLFAAATAQAQIEARSPTQQRRANRLAVREARHAPTPFPDHHVAVTHQQFRRGESPPIPPVAGEPRFDRDGTPHVTEPKYPGLRLRKHKTDSSH